MRMQTNANSRKRLRSANESAQIEPEREAVAGYMLRMELRRACRQPPPRCMHCGSRTPSHDARLAACLKQNQARAARGGERTVHRDRVVATGHKLGDAREPFDKHGRFDVARRRSAATALAFAVIAPAPELPALILEERVEEATADHTSQIYKPRPECGWLAWTAHGESDGGKRDWLHRKHGGVRCGAVRPR